MPNILETFLETVQRPLKEGIPDIRIESIWNCFIQYHNSPWDYALLFKTKPLSVEEFEEFKRSLSESFRVSVKGESRQASSSNLITSKQGKSENSNGTSKNSNGSDQNLKGARPIIKKGLFRRSKKRGSRSSFVIKKEIEGSTMPFIFQLQFNRNKQREIDDLTFVDNLISNNILSDKLRKELVGQIMAATFAVGDNLEFGRLKETISDIKMNGITPNNEYELKVVPCKNDAERCFSEVLRLAIKIYIPPVVLNSQHFKPKPGIAGQG